MGGNRNEEVGRERERRAHPRISFLGLLWLGVGARILQLFLLVASVVELLEVRVGVEVVIVVKVYIVFEFGPLARGTFGELDAILLGREHRVFASSKRVDELREDLRKRYADAARAMNDVCVRVREQDRGGDR